MARFIAARSRRNRYLKSCAFASGFAVRNTLQSCRKRMEVASQRSRFELDEIRLGSEWPTTQPLRKKRIGFGMLFPIAAKSNLGCLQCPNCQICSMVRRRPLLRNGCTKSSFLSSVQPVEVIESSQHVVRFGDM